MGCIVKISSWASLLFAFLAFNHVGADDLSQLYCSSDNTGSETSPLWSQWQSNSLCFNHCVAQYAFAVVQYKNCWCANYIPVDQQSISNCNESCPGFPSDKCGNHSSGVFGYIRLSIAPWATAGAATASRTSSSQRSISSAASPTSPSLVQASPIPTTGTSTAAEIVTPSSTSALQTSRVTSVVTQAPIPSSTPLTSTSTTPTSIPVANTQVITILGAIITQSVTSTFQPVATSDTGNEESRHQQFNTGALTGGLVGGLAGLALLAALLLFLWRRRGSEKLSTTKRLDRNASVLSTAGLIGSGRAWDPETLLNEPAYGAQRRSTLYSGTENSPISMPGRSYEGSGSLGRRNSRPLVYDQRLNPAALIEHWHFNGSQSSINTMQDQRDYSRPLGVTNPNPRDL